jgi:hypothetical protein
MIPSPARWLVSLVAITLVAAACGQPEPAAPPPPTRVENAELGLALAALPDGVSVETNAGAVLRFATAGAGGEGRLTISVGGAGEAVNVVEEAKRARAELEARPEARFSGGNELVTPAGAGYAVRGSYADGTARVEERRIFALHPDGSGRLLTLVERYPAGDAADSNARFGRTLALLGELQAIPASAGS